jgi:hypothetical protein
MTDTESIKSALSKAAVEYWRVTRSYERNLLNLPNSSSAAATIRNSEKKFSAILAETGLRMISCEGKEYSPNLPITVVNGDEFASNEHLLVSQMIEPTIMDGDRIISMGKAILTKKES